MHKLRGLWDDLRTSLWFVPGLIVAAAVILAVWLIDLDSSGALSRLSERWPRLFGAGAEGARGLLATIAGSMINVAGVTFSITVVALALASSQYTSRILRNFMRDRANQTVLGVFVGVFAYCLVVLRSVRGTGGGAFVPALSVVVAVLLALLAIGFFIFFIHHIADAIQASSVVEAAADETFHAVDRLFPAESDGGTAPAGGETVAAAREWTEVVSSRTGYVQGIDAEALFALARESDVVIRLTSAPGEFVLEGSPVAATAGRAPDEELVARIQAAWTVGRNRTMHQDASYGVRQIVDVALKALSPGINDTTTAINCVDYLGAILARLADRRMGPWERRDEGRVRLIVRRKTFSDFLDGAFDQIRQNAEANVAVLLRMLGVLETVASRTANPERRSALDRHADWILEAAERRVPAAHDRIAIQAARLRVSPASGERVARTPS